MNWSSQPSDAEILSKKYPAKAHARKVAAELRSSNAPGLDKGIVFLPGEPTRLYEDSDQGPDFRQRRYFYYITGCDIADCAVTYELARDKLTLWIPFVEPRQALWFGNVPSASKASGIFDVDEVRYRKELPKFFKVHPSTTLFILHKSQIPRALPLEASGERPVIDATNLKPAMDRARVIKDRYEVALIKKANNISSTAHRMVARKLLSLKNEQHVEAIFLAACTAKGAHSQAYHVIAGAGDAAATLHYFANNQPLKGKELMVVDAGCEYSCYASDVTRTLPINGKFSKEAGAIYDIVEKMQEACIEAVKPGKLFVELHLLAASIAVDGLLELGILKGDRDEVEESRVISAFFPHGLGHHVGLEVHDVSGDERLLYANAGQRVESGKREIVTPVEMGELRKQNASILRQALQPGMIVTVEPGM